MRSAALRVAATVAAIVLIAAGAQRSYAAEAAATAAVVNINTGTLEELMFLPGVGPSKARAIAEFRKANGPFESVEQLLQVKGIGERALERIRGFVVLKGKTTASGPVAPLKSGG